jgi:hypothetical protein
MSERVAIILARRADVFRAISARRRLMLSWVVQTLVFAAACVSGIAGGSLDRFQPLLLLGGCFILVWSALEAVMLLGALREPPGVLVMTMLGIFVPIAAPILTIVMLWESVAVLKIAARMRKAQCARCGYDLRGITSVVCPECGWRMDKTEP